MSTGYVPNFDFLDEDEKELVRLDPSTARSDQEKQAAVAEFRRAARVGSTKVISLRIDSMALERLKKQAETDGLPYQTMIQSILARYMNGSLVDIKAVREIVKALQA